MKLQPALWIWLGWMLFAPVRTQAAPAPLRPALPDTTAVSDSVTKKGWWTIELETANNASFYGRNTAQKYPYVATTITYAHNSGLWASVTSYQLFNTEDYVDETDASVGYSFKITPRATGNISYSHFFFSQNTPLVKSVTANALTAYTAVDWKILYTAVTTSYVFGGSSDLFVVLDNSRYIPLNPLWKGKRAIGLDPKISITGGTQEFSETHTITEQKKKGIGGAVGGVLDPLKPGNGGSTNTTTATVHRFKVLTYDFLVPVVVDLGNFELEPSWRYSIPVNLLEGDESEAQSFFTFKASCTF
ncbi:hypothetical protein I2I11_08205 [Pontibacter sp. 172403-2]|uniref:hypothetical protein n=1 Tax=Pontibacter rufus TaxID=2791028 RepID=UPI0018AF7965|nr:hypothetical protein [Pontibacter sp. 172403-2]MBF9253271.1 hypothetical protein [Pontibacter sp. 172403-2]